MPPRIQITGIKLPYPIKVLVDSRKFAELPPLEAFDIGFRQRCNELKKDHRKAKLAFLWISDPCKAYRQGWRLANEYFNKNN